MKAQFYRQLVIGEANFFQLELIGLLKKKKEKKKKKKKKERKELIGKEFGPYEINISGHRVYYFVTLIQYICFVGGGAYLSRGGRCNSNFPPWRTKQ